MIDPVVTQPNSEKSERKTEDACGTCAFFGKLSLCPRRERYNDARPCKLHKSTREIEASEYTLMQYDARVHAWKPWEIFLPSFCVALFAVYVLMPRALLGPYASGAESLLAGLGHLFRVLFIAGIIASIITIIYIAAYAIKK